MGIELAARYTDLLARGELGSLVSEHPWPHFVLDGFVDPASFTEARDRVIRNAGVFDLDPDPRLNIQLQYMMDVEMAEFFFSGPVRALLEQISGHALRPNPALAIQLRRMTPESPPFPPHVDQVECKTLAALYYLAPDWAPGKGGEVVLLKDEHASFESGDATWIAPLANRLLLFHTEAHHWHAVRSIRNWTRYFILTEWLVD